MLENNDKSTKDKGIKKMKNNLKTSYYLVDYENTGQKGIEDLSNLHEGDNLIVFYSYVCDNITLSLVEKLNEIGVKLSVIKATVGTKNALDFQLSSYLGYLIKEFGSNAQYYIVSDDKGYGCLCDFWNSFNIHVGLIGTDKQNNRYRFDRVLGSNNIIEDFEDAFKDEEYEEDEDEIHETDEDEDDNDYEEDEEE